MRFTSLKELKYVEFGKPVEAENLIGTLKKCHQQKDLRTDNIFEFSKPVEAENLIGYKKQYENLCRDIVKNHRSILLVGLPKIGKTSLIKKLHKEAKSKDKIIEILIDNLQKFNSEENPFAAILINIAENLKDNINKNNAKDFSASFDKLQNLYGTHNYGINFQDAFKKLLREIKKLDMHVIMSVDDLNLSEKMSAFLRELITNSTDYSINVVLISRHQKSKAKIEKEIQRIANAIIKRFPKGIDPKLLLAILEEEGRPFSYESRQDLDLLKVPLEGLSNDDVQAFFSILTKNYGIELSPEQREKIKYYAGRLPYIYSLFCYHIVEEKLSGQDTFDIEKIYNDNVEKTVIDYANNLYKHLKEYDYLDKINNILFGSKDKVTPSDKKLLLGMGYISEISEESNLSGSYHQALSGYFTDYLQEQYLLQYFSKDLASNIVEVHRLMKTIIRESFCPLDDNGWSKVMKKVFRYRNNKDEFQSSNFKTALRKNREFFGTSSLLDVLPFKYLFDIIELYWESVFKKYFGNQSFLDFKKKFDLCAKIRDFALHANDVPEEDKRNVNIYCTEILRIVKDNQRKSLKSPTKFDPFKEKFNDGLCKD